jgi:hypothetical protein
MRPKHLVYAIAVSAVFFISGLAVGQRTSTSKFAKYLQPTTPPLMELITLEANIDRIRDSVPMDANEGITIPQAVFDLKNDRLLASAAIYPEFEKASLDSIKSRITTRYFGMYSDLKALIPELSADDFVLRITRFTVDPERKLFAECKNGTIVFH